MSQRIKGKITRLCQSLFYRAGVRLCPALRKKSAAVDEVAVDRSARSNPAARTEDNVPCPGKGVGVALSVLGRVAGSLPFTAQSVQTAEGLAVLVCKLQDPNPEFGTKVKADEPCLKRTNREESRSLRTGFDLLRVTFNLARGNLEELACAP